MGGELIYGSYNASLPRPLSILFAKASVDTLCQGPNRGMKKHQYDYCMFVGGFTPV